MKKYYLSIVIAFLLGLTIFSVYKYTLSLKERHELLAAIEEANGQAQMLESKNQNLRSELDKGQQSRQKLQLENADLKDALRNNVKQFTHLSRELETTQKQAEIFHNRLIQLQGEKENLNLRLAEVSQEKEGLQAIFHSIPDLKKRIRELKGHIRQSPEAGALQAKNTGAEDTIGNQGYLLKAGKTTVAPRIRIEVQPAILTQ